MNPEKGLHILVERLEGAAALYGDITFHQAAQAITTLEAERAALSKALPHG